VIGSLQALEAIKYLAGIGTTIKGQLLVWESGTTDFKKFKIRKDPDCSTCGEEKLNI